MSPASEGKSIAISDATEESADGALYNGIRRFDYDLRHAIRTDSTAAR